MALMTQISAYYVQRLQNSGRAEWSMLSIGVKQLRFLSYIFNYVKRHGVKFKLVDHLTL